MRKKSIEKFSLLLIIGLMLITSVLLLPSNTNATETVKSSSTGTVSTVSSKDTYVDSSKPSSNFGGEEILFVGGQSDHLHESYFCFGFGDKPADYQKAEITLDIFHIKQTTNINIHIITETWEEYTLTWNNKPAKNTKIITLQLTSDGWHIIDITNFISDEPSITSISICVSVQTITDDYVVIGSREADGGFFGEYIYYQSYPQLIWTYEAVVSESDDNGDGDKKPVPDVIGGIFSFIMVMIITFIIIGLIIILAIPFLIIPFIRRTKQKQKQQQRQDIVINIPDTQQTTTMKYCSSCNEKINQNIRFCTYCGAQQL